MDPTTTFDTVADYTAYNQQTPQHPLISLVDLSLADERCLRRMRFNLYTIFLKEIKCGDLRYGCGHYDYEAGTLVFIGPGQVVGSPGTDRYQPRGKALVVHPDFLTGTTLGPKMMNYGFFHYAMSEALHLSDRERSAVEATLLNIAHELSGNIDGHTKTLVISHLELLLNYCKRFYDRQFITREHVNLGVVAEFEKLLHGYFQSDQYRAKGLPTVQYFARALHLSPNYFGDLVYRQTGRSPQDLIGDHLVGVAKQRLLDPALTVAMVAYELGFQYPQHFSRMFKRRVGQTPGAWRNAG